MKLFTKEIKIALTAISASALLFIGINFLKGINLLKLENSYYVEFTNIKGLAVSSQVFVNGFQVGIIRNIAYNYDKPGHVVIEFNIDKNMRIPKGSSAIVDSEILGGATMSLLLAPHDGAYYEPRDTIKGTNKQTLFEKAELLLPQVESSIAKFDSIMTSLNTLLADPALVAIVHNTEQATRNLNKSVDMLNNLLSNDVKQLSKTFNDVGNNMISITEKINEMDLQTTLARVDQTLDNVHNVTEKLNQRNNTVGLLLNDPSLYNNLNTTVNSANSLLEDLKKQPKRYVHFSLFGRREKQIDTISVHSK